MYTILMISMVALVCTHYSYAPNYLTLGVPGVLTLVVIVRVGKFVRARNQQFTDAQVKRGLRSMVFAAFALGCVFTAWALSLYSYGDAYRHGHIAFFVGINALGCVMCVLHLRAAALAVFASVVLPFTVFFMLSGNPVFFAIAINLFLVSIASVMVMFRYSKSFEDMTAHQVALSGKQQEMSALSNENQRIANEDFLTGLPNRRSFFYELERRLAEDVQSGDATIVGVLDLDGFKPVNDVYGHVAGDNLLILVAERLKELCAHGAFAARLGGDEFALILPDIKEDTALLAQGERVCAKMRQPFEQKNFVARMSASLGLARSEPGELRAGDLYERADYALYHAKQQNVGCPAIFSDEHREAIGRRSAVDRGLRDADLKAEMTLAFQPIVDIDSGCVCGFEVLARWLSPTLGAVSPSEFIPAAERAGLVSTLTDVLFEKALESVGSWLGDCYISFNLSAYDISSSDRISRIVDMLQASGLDPKKISFEVTETSLMNEFDRAIESLQTLRGIGAKIALDDFGTGYSSLSYLRKLPIDKLKVDRSFITELADDPEAQDVTGAVIILCDSLNLECIVEGVETEAQLTILHDMGCQLIQGYYFSHPLDVEAIGPYVAAQEKLRKRAS